LRGETTRFNLPAPNDEEIVTMKSLATGLVGAGLLTAALSSGAAAQYGPSYADDMACRQYADQATVSVRNQAAASTAGNTLIGAGLGAALGAAIGGGRGAGIGAASGAIAGTGLGAANAPAAQYSVDQWYAYYYQQCMASRPAAAPAYAPPQQAPGYYPQYQQPQYQQPYPGYR
jgi:outer membrane lipoprotein SlyB